MIKLFPQCEFQLIFAEVKIFSQKLYNNVANPPLGAIIKAIKACKGAIP